MNDTATPSTFVSDADLEPAINQVYMAFEVGNLYSRSKPSETYPVALEACQDYNLPTRRSLVLYVAKRAQARWLAAIDKCKGE